MNVFLGVLLLALGVGTLWAQIFTTLASVYFLGWVLLLGGAGLLLSGITSGIVRRAVMYSIVGLIAIAIGLTAIINTALSAVTFTLFIAAMLVVSGVYRIFATLMNREQNWGWHLTGGIISLLLGIAVILSWPVSGLFVIGFFIGVELLINGVLLIIQPAAFYEGTPYPTSSYLSGVKGGKSRRKEKGKK